MAKVKPIPDGYPRVSPYLCIEGAAKAIDYYKDVFGAQERVRMDAPGGTLGHAEIQIGDAVIMLADPFPGAGNTPPSKTGGTPVTLCLYVEDVDDVTKRAVKAGGKELNAPQDQFYGDRTSMVEDPFGHKWNIQTHIEDVAPDEMMKRAAATMGG